MPALHVAYILLAHAAPRQLCRLVSTLDGSHASFLIHVDKRAPDAVYREARRELAGNPRVSFLRRRPSRRATFALVDVPLDALETLRARDDAFDYAVLLSGQDYPIKPQSALLARLAENPDECFLHAFPIEDPERSEWPPAAAFRYRSWHPGFGNPRWRVPLGRRIPGGREPFGGSMYWALPRIAVDYIAYVIEREPRLVKFFKHTFAPDEMFFQTILMNSPLRERVTTLSDPDCYGLHYIDWHRGLERPETLRRDDVPKLASTAAFFARKFDMEVDAAILDVIDADLLCGR